MHVGASSCVVGHAWKRYVMVCATSNVVSADSAPVECTLYLPLVANAWQNSPYLAPSPTALVVASPTVKVSPTATIVVTAVATARATSPIGEPYPGPTPNATSACLFPVNVNTGTLAQLDCLPGIGPVLAQRIIDGRPYATCADLDVVKGIGQKTLDAICPLVTF